MRISFIIPALNEERNLPRCLASITALDRPKEVADVEVIVVDNQSTDRTADRAREAGARVVTVPPGRVSRSRNAGVREASGDVLAFVDADCELSRDWMTRCVSYLQADREIVAVGTRMSPPAADAPWVERVWYSIAHAGGSPESELVDWLATFNLLLRRDAFEAVGGFDESLVTCEDSDLGYRLSARGKLLRDHVARTAHHGESKTLGQLFRREAWRSRGNIRSLLNRRLVLSELPSVLIPPVLVLAWIGGVVLLASGLFADSPLAAGIGFALLLGAVLLPAVKLLQRRITPLRPVLFARGWVLITAYLWARAVGLVVPLGRVGR